MMITYSELIAYQQDRRKWRYLKWLLITALFILAPVCRADSITDVASTLRADVSIPFRYGVATDLATNLLDAQASATYAGIVSLALSIDAVVRAIGIDNTAWVGWASTDPITWLQSTIAIDPGATIGITPNALWFGDVAVATVEPSTLIYLLVGLAGLAIGYYVVCWAFRRLRESEAPPVISTDYGPTTEWARKQAALQMRFDPDVKRIVEDALTERLGSTEAGIAESMRRYPECYRKD